MRLIDHTPYCIRSGAREASHSRVIRLAGERDGETKCGEEDNGTVLSQMDLENLRWVDLEMRSCAIWTRIPAAP